MAVTDPNLAAEAEGAPPKPDIVYRHSVAVRATHWINVLCLILLLLSGLRIFNYHPALYWGNYGYFGVPALLDIGSDYGADRALEGVTVVAGRRFVTTGVLGVSRTLDGQLVRRAMPTWLTLPGEPGLSLARDWHFSMAWLFVANGVIYLLFGLISGHFRCDLLPTADQLRPRHILADLWDHLRLRPPRGEAARCYNPLQKLSYIGVIFVLLPLVVLTGLTMSPAVTAAMPWLFDLFAGRQSARTIHFLCAGLIVLFALIHVAEVIVAGAANEMRSMITGRFTIRPDRR